MTPTDYNVVSMFLAVVTVIGKHIIRCLHLSHPPRDAPMLSSLQSSKKHSESTWILSRHSDRAWRLWRTVPPISLFSRPCDQLRGSNWKEVATLRTQLHLQPSPGHREALHTRSEVRYWQTSCARVRSSLAGFVVREVLAYHTISIRSEQEILLSTCFFTASRFQGKL